MRSQRSRFSCQQLLRQPGRLAAKDQVILRRESWLPCRAAARSDSTNQSRAPRRQCLLESRPVRPAMPLDLLPVIHAGALELRVVQLEPERLDQVQACSAWPRTAAPRCRCWAGSPVQPGRRAWRCPGSCRLVEHLPQHQPVRRRGHARHAPVLLRQHPLDLLGRKLAQPHLHQRAHDAAAHLVEKAVAFDDEGQQRPAAA